jgi:hypothetical protein
MIEAAVKREERQLRFLAVMTANLMNCWLKRAVTVEQLLGVPSRGGGDGYADQDEGGKAAVLDRIAKKLERIRAKKAKKSRC